MKSHYNKHLQLNLAFYICLFFSVLLFNACNDKEDTPPPNPEAITIEVRDSSGTTAAIFGTGNTHRPDEFSDYYGAIAYSQDNPEPTMFDYTALNILPTRKESFDIVGRLNYLLPETKTYARAYISCSVCGEIAWYGNTISFITPKEFKIPVVSTDSVFNLGDSSASFAGHLSSEGASAITMKGIKVYQQDKLSLIRNGDSILSIASGTQILCSTKKLKPNTKYYYRAFARNSYGTGYGKEYSFMSKDIGPSNIIRVTGVHLGGKPSGYDPYYSMAKARTISRDSGMQTSNLIDFFFEDHSDFGCVLWGPNDPEVKWSLPEIENWTVRKTTWMIGTSVTPDEFKNATSDELIIKFAPNSGTKMTGIQTNNVIAFKLTNGKLGLILITDIQKPNGSGSRYITFDYIIQK